MRKMIKLAAATALLLSATSAFATNGDTMIGVGAKAVGMGGVGIGMSHGAESAISNPAMIANVAKTELSFGGTVFMPNVKTDLVTAGGSDGYLKSDADLSIIPTVAVASKATENFYWGVGMYGVAGMGTDYSDRSGGMTNNMKMKTNLQLMQFVVPLAFKINGFSIGVAPILQYGSLDINYVDGLGNDSKTQGVSQDFGAGYTAGIGYEIAGVKLGASYKSAIDMVYSGQISEASKQFNIKGGAGFGDHLEQPAEMGAGVSYSISGHTVAFDYKKIKWSDAKGYKNFKWEDQNVYMLGYQYAQNSWAVRAGYNYAKSPIKKLNGAASYDNSAINMFNLLGFPAIVEKHYTAGGSYAFNDTISLDLALVYSPTKKVTADISSMPGMSEISTKHSQKAATLQLNFNF